MRTKAPEKKFHGSYGKFLETVSQSEAPEARQAELRVALLRELAAQGGQAGMKALLGRIEGSPLALARRVDELKAQELVTVKETGADDIVELTALGHTVARLEQGR